MFLYLIPQKQCNTCCTVRRPHSKKEEFREVVEAVRCDGPAFSDQQQQQHEQAL